MADAAALARCPPNVGSPPDGTQGPARERTVASNFEIVELARDYRRHVLRRERIRSDVVNNLANVYDELRKLRFTQRPDRDGWIVATIPQLRGRVYDDDKQTEGREQSVRRWLQELARDLKVIDLEAHTVGTGKFVGFRFRLRSSGAWWSLDSALPAGVAQSVGATTCGVSRRPETRRQREHRRVAPYRRRTGRGGVGRYLLGPLAGGRAEQAFLSSCSLSARSGAPPFPPTGERGSRESRRGHEQPGDAGRPPAVPTADELVAPAWWLTASSGTAWPPPRRAGAASDALHRACPADQHAALDGLWCLGIEQGGLDGVVRAGAAGAPPAAVLLAMWALACPGREPRFSRDARAQLERSWAQLERLHGPGAAAAALGELFRGVQNGVDLHTYAEIHTAAWAVLALKSHARAARRYRRGAPPPRPWRPRGAL